MFVFVALVVVAVAHVVAIACFCNGNVVQRRSRRTGGERRHLAAPMSGEVHGRPAPRVIGSGTLPLGRR